MGESKSSLYTDLVLIAERNEKKSKKEEKKNLEKKHESNGMSDSKRS